LGRQGKEPTNFPSWFTDGLKPQKDRERTSLLQFNAFAHQATTSFQTEGSGHLGFSLGYGCSRQPPYALNWFGLLVSQIQLVHDEAPKYISTSSFSTILYPLNKVRLEGAH